MRRPEEYTGWLGAHVRNQLLGYVLVDVNIATEISNYYEQHGW